MAKTEKSGQGNKSPNFKFWVQHSTKCISFHNESTFEMESFKNSQTMWLRIYELIEQDYSIR